MRSYEIHVYQGNPTVGHDGIMVSLRVGGRTITWPEVFPDEEQAVDTAVELAKHLRGTSPDL